MESWLVHSSYYFMFILCLLWITHLWQYISYEKFSLTNFLRQNWQGILGALLLATIVFISLEPNYRVLSDETNLLAVSKSMTYDKTVWNDTMGKWFYNEFHPIKQEIPKRPFIFPFLASLLHTVFGYSRDNLFLLNFLALFILLCLAYCCTRSALDKTSAFAAMVLIISQPIVTLTATSAGFDLLSVTFLALTLVALYGFLTEPSSPSLAFLWCNLLVFSNIRYESAVYFLFIIGFLALSRLLRKAYFLDFLYLYLVTPILFIPLISQVFLSKASYAEGTDELFSITNILPHLTELIQNQFRFDYFLPYANVVNLIGFIILIFCIINIFTKPDTISPLQKYYFLAVILFLIAHNTIYLAHYFGKYSHPASARFFIGLVVFLSLMPVILKGMVKNISSNLLLGFALISFATYHPVAVQNRFFNTLELIRKTDYVRGFLQNLNERRILLIIDRPGQYTAENYGAVDFDYANQNADSLLSEFDRSLYQEIIVVQDIIYDNNQPIQTNQLNQKFQLQTIEKQQYTANQYIRFSKIKLGDHK